MAEIEAVAEVVEADSRAALVRWSSAGRVRRWARELEAIGLGRSAGSGEGARGQRQSDADRVAALRLLLAYAVGPPRGEDDGGGGGRGGWRFRLPATGRMVEAVPVIGVPIDSQGRMVGAAVPERMGLLGGGGGSGEGGRASPDGGRAAVDGAPADAGPDMAASRDEPTPAAPTPSRGRRGAEAGPRRKPGLAPIAGAAKKGPIASTPAGGEKGPILGE